MMMNKVLLNTIKGLAGAACKGIVAQIKKVANVSIKTNAAEIFNNLKKAVSDFRNSIIKDTRKFKDIIRDGFRMFRKDVTQDTKDFKNTVVGIVEKAEATVEVNNVKVIEFKNHKLSLNKDAIEHFASEVFNNLLNITMNKVLGKLSSFATSVPALKVA
jgi:ubiquitin C-terminal hydrolase